MKLQPIIFSAIIVSTLLFSACDDREDIWSKNDYLSSFLLTNEAGDSLNVIPEGYSDTIKLNQPSNYLYDIEYAVDCEFNFKYDTNLCEVLLNTADKTISFTGHQIGEIPVELTVTDPFGRKKVSIINFFITGNSPPVAIGTITDISTSYGKRKKFDASGSYDPDQEFGDSIVFYNFEIVKIINENQIETEDAVTTTIPNFIQTYYSSGEYIFKLKVQDSYGNWSEVVQDTFKIYLISPL